MTEITKRHEKSLDLKCGLVVVALISLLPCTSNGAVVYSQPANGAFLRQSSQIGYDRFSSDYDQYVWDGPTDWGLMAGANATIPASSPGLAWATSNTSKFPATSRSPC